MNLTRPTINSFSCFWITFLVAVWAPFLTELPVLRAEVNLAVPVGTPGQFWHGMLVTKKANGELIVAPSPLEATHTHPGVDFVAACGSQIYPIADGEVIDLIGTPKDNDFLSLGYMALVKHKIPVRGREIYSIYLHMQGPPSVKRNQEVKVGQTVLGKVGSTGAAFGCHTHLEIRYFPSRYFMDPRWNRPWNIYGKGDQRDTIWFNESWDDPIAFLLEDLTRTVSGKPIAVASSNEELDIYPLPAATVALGNGKTRTEPVGCFPGPEGSWSGPTTSPIKA
jgi:hypothetical protein